MKIREGGKSMVAGSIVYVTMAACSASGIAPTGSNTATGGRGGSGPFAGGAGSVNGYDAGEIWDALTDPVAEASAAPVSGSRLKAKYRIADDGSKEYLPGNWYDSQRQEDCVFFTASDGAQRCMPSPTLMITGALFSDATCVILVAQVYVTPACPTPPVPKYAYTMATLGCTSRHSAHVTGAEASADGLYQLVGAKCIKAYPSSGVVYYSVGTEIPASSFVGATVMHD